MGGKKIPQKQAVPGSGWADICHDCYEGEHMVYVRQCTKNHKLLSPGGYLCIKSSLNMSSIEDVAADVLVDLHGIFLLSFNRSD